MKDQRHAVLTVGYAIFFSCTRNHEQTITIPLLVLCVCLLTLLNAWIVNCNALLLLWGKGVQNNKLPGFKVIQGNQSAREKWKRLKLVLTPQRKELRDWSQRKKNKHHLCKDLMRSVSASCSDTGGLLESPHCSVPGRRVNINCVTACREQSIIYESLWSFKSELEVYFIANSYPHLIEQKEHFNANKA